MAQSTYGYNQDYLIKDQMPWFPVMGEMHYSRYRKELWEESLRKIKAGGVSVVSMYVIWIHHEEEEGIFDFEGCRDVGCFVKLCQKVGLSVFMRLGPFVHGEVRNGGFPDWLVKKEKEGLLLRSNQEEYLCYVRRFWTKVYEQVKGSMAEDGGPVIGVQIENEYGHVGGLRGPEGEAHMRTLTALAKEIGFRVPLYTATGWGGACIGDLLPVMGGYCEAPWDQRTCELEPNTNFVFSHTRNDSMIACDHHVEDANTYREEDFPFLTAELGGGLQVTMHRRPVAQGRDVGAMSTVKLGSGAALLGYYMYHGGSNSKGKLSTLQESRATGYLNDLPEINYDFNAPIRQYGTIADSYKEIKLLAYFLQDFGEDMAVLKAEIPAKRIVPGDMHTLRITCRHDATHGYVFFNNYQRRMKMDDHMGVQLCGLLGDFDETEQNADRKKVLFPAFDLREGMYGFFPYGMKLKDATLKTALATPLCRLHTRQADTFVFYGCQDPQIEWEDEKQADILHLSREEALNAWKVTTDQDYLILSENYVWEEHGEIKVTGGNRTKIAIYPKPEDGIENFTVCGESGRFTVYERVIEEEKTRACVKTLREDREKAIYEIALKYPDSLHKEDRLAGRDILLQFTYQGNRMEVYSDGEKLNDYFYTGQEVPFSLGYFDFPQKLTVEVFPLGEEDAVFLEKRPEFTDGIACRLSTVRVEEQFRQATKI